MKLINYPPREEWPALALRPAEPASNLESLVTGIFEAVRHTGDTALRRYTEQFDKVRLNTFRVSADELAKSGMAVPEELKGAIQLAARNIETFHATQLAEEQVVETSKGVYCWRENRPVEKVGLYIPGGSAPLFSTVLMLGIPARLAGCKEIILCSPPGKDGQIHPLILYAAQLIGINTIYKAGGAQAIAALTFGTESVPKADKIFGPGNQYVTAAKQLAQRFGTAIDLPAGPSEVLVIADQTCVPEFVAADLLSQAEHGADSQVMLVSDNAQVILAVTAALAQQLQLLPRKAFAELALQQSKCILLKDLDDCLAFSNLYAPEHLILAIDAPKDRLAQISCAGSVFIGNYSCESAGDYASGTNHTLPTNGYAKSYSGVSLDSFVKKISFQELSREGLQAIGPAIACMAEAEHLLAHKNAVSIRLTKITG